MADKYFNKKYLKSLFNKKLASQTSKGIDKRNSLLFKQNIGAELDVIVNKVKANTYKFSPYLEILKSKGRNKNPRLISIPTVRDRIVLLAIKELLHESFPECVNRRLPNKFIRDIKKYVSNETAEIHYLKLDIEQFYDRINRDILLSMLKNRGLERNVIDLIAKAIENPTVPLNAKKDSYEEFRTDKGVPQGLSISNILAQIYLSELDQIFAKRKYFYTRYVDDILILNNGPISSYRIKNIQSTLSEIGLALNPDKTKSGTLTGGIKFLGYVLNDRNVSIADKNVELYIRRIAGKFTWLKDRLKHPNKRPNWIATDDRFKEVFIEELNDSITGVISSSKNYGWLFYFSELTDKSLLFRLDKIISSFFDGIDAFNNTRPLELKSLVKAYHAIIYGANREYICNLDEYNTISKKRNHLIYRGKIDPIKRYSDEEIEQLFKSFSMSKIRYLESDVGYRYF